MTMTDEMATSTKNNYFTLIDPYLMGNYVGPCTTSLRTYTY